MLPFPATALVLTVPGALPVLRAAIVTQIRGLPGDLGGRRPPLPQALAQSFQCNIDADGPPIPEPVLDMAGHCFKSPRFANLVTMTGKPNARAGTSPRSPRGQWRLQDAKARFSELVRLAHSEGPQRVTPHGRDAVVVVDAQEFRRLKGERMGRLLINALQASPHRDIEIDPHRSAMPVRDVSL